MIPKWHMVLENCEDAWAGNLEAGLWAVCDGATTASYSGPWARSLAQLVVNSRLDFTQGSPTQELLSTWLAPAQHAWFQEIPWGNLDYFSKKKAHLGSYATLAAISFPEVPQLVAKTVWGWEADVVDAYGTVVGDAAILLVQEGQLVRSWPYSSTADFQGAPYAVGSLPEHNGQLAQHWLGTGKISLGPGDYLLLATDALAAFLMNALAQESDALEGRGRQQILAWLDNLLQADELSAELNFSELVAQAREHKELRDDDVALILLKLQQRI